jgi:hypothetical protein
VAFAAGITFGEALDELERKLERRVGDARDRVRFAGRSAFRTGALAARRPGYDEPTARAPSLR